VQLRNAVRSPLLGPHDAAADEAVVANFRSDAVSGASSLEATKSRSGSASLLMVRSVKRYWRRSEPLV